MGFGGAAGAMNAVIKNNSKLLRRRKLFKIIVGQYNHKTGGLKETAKPQKHVINRIRTRF